MRNKAISSLDRRRFLRLGTLGGLLGAVGCGGDGTTVTTAPVEKGNRSRLEKRKSMAEEILSKKKKKK